MEQATSEAALVERLKARDPIAWNELARAQARRLLGLAHRVTGNAADAEEATQEALLAAWRGIGAFEGRASVGTWLHHITRNAAVARLKSHQRHPELSLDDEPGPEASASPAPPMEQVELSQAVRGAVDALDELSRAVLVLRDVEELSSQEVSQALGLSDAAVRQRLHRARRTVAERLRPELCEGRTLTCGGELGLLLDALDRSLPADLEGPVTAHVAGCEACQRLGRGYRAVIASLHDAAWPVTGEAADKVVAKLVAALPAPGN